LIIYPAIDLRGGKVVRLRQGDPSQQTVYSDNPLEIADRWIAAGAEWLHVVNLDGTFADTSDNENQRIIGLLAKRGIPVQFGGGLRTLDDIERAFAKGISRVVLGTIAIENPDIAQAVIEQYGPEAVSVGLDARNGKVTTRGWQQTTDVSPAELGARFISFGARHALYTDVSRDGELRGVNVTATVDLAKQTGLQVIASGGVTSYEDIVALRDSHIVAGAILGTALYEGLIDLAEAIRLALDESE
jgi:phosphoribosylformimino-5-aminoimidazole carboxamide ribotide isomerase